MTLINNLLKSLLLGLVVFVNSGSLYAATPITVKASLSIDTTKAELNFIIKNESRLTVHLFNGGLPWSNPDDVVIVAAWRWGDLLTVTPPPPAAHFIGGKIIDLRPNKVLNGTVYLDNHIEHLAEARKKGDVIVFWWYEPWDSERKAKLGQFGGWVFLPKTK